MNVLGVILARGGSVRVPGKNTRMLGEWPLIAWTIESAKRSMFLDDIVVSSDSDEILAVAIEHGVKILKRPLEMAMDTSESYPALMHAVDCYESVVDLVCLLQPTSPFRSAYDIDCCIMAMFYDEPHPASVAVTCDERVPNGSVYVGRVDWLRECLARGHSRPFDLPMCERYIMPTYRSIDINTEEDFKLAEALLRKYSE